MIERSLEHGDSDRILADGVLEQRLRDLRTEFSRGEEQLAVLDGKRRELQETMLRISVAIQVLEELLSGPATGDRETENSDSHVVSAFTG